MNEQTTVIYHSADFDGKFCREIARKFLPGARLVGWNFGDQPLALLEGKIFVLDLPVDRVFGFDFRNPDDSQKAFHFLQATKGLLVWIDHHKSAIESHPASIPGYRLEGVAACRLAWQWFWLPTQERHEVIPMPSKQEFIDRLVSEPFAVRLAGEYDIHDPRMKTEPDIELFQHGLKSQALTTQTWDDLLQGAPTTVKRLLNQGAVLKFVRDREYRHVIKQQGFDAEFEGLKFLACNSHEEDIRSQLFDEGIKPHHEALLGFTYTGKDWRISLYHVDGRPVQPNILAIAKKYKGGGHEGACGFHLERLPFAL